MTVTPTTPGPPTSLAQAEIQLYAMLQHAGAKGPQTSEFWVAILTKPVTFGVTWLLSFLVAHALLGNAIAVAISSTVSSSIATYAAGMAAAAYIRGRSMVKASLLDLHARLGVAGALPSLPMPRTVGATPGGPSA